MLSIETPGACGHDAHEHMVVSLANTRSLFLLEVACPRFLGLCRDLLRHHC